jgi:MoaA/NifB/PqqE/SkfB family radical SAM enzyme
MFEERPAAIRDDSVVMSTWFPPIPSSPFNRLVRAEVKQAMGLPVPQTVSIELTRQCACNCRNCIVSGGEGEMTTSQLKGIIDQVLEMGACIVTFTEGDPLLRDDCLELVEYVDPDKAIVNIFTPGTELSYKKAKSLKDAGLHNLLVSVYSVNAETHDARRRLDGAHKAALMAIKNGLKAGLLVTLATHVDSKNIDGIQQLYELARELGVHEFSLWESTPRLEVSDTLQPSDRQKILSLYHDSNTNGNGTRVFASTHFEGKMMGCLAGRRWMHIGVDGRVRPCPYIPLDYGNVLEIGVKNVWSKMSRNYRKRQMTCRMHGGALAGVLSNIPPDADLPVNAYDFHIEKGRS